MMKPANLRVRMLVVLAGFTVAMSSSVSVGEVTFVSGPTAARSGKTTVIAFEVSEPTDVEVAVLGPDGTVVRHLAAGVLGGGNPPPKPLRPGLAQRLEWDGRDDLGQPVAGGPFKARVGLGLRPAFEKIIGGNPGGLGYVVGLAVGSDGSLYVMNCFGDLHPGDGSTACQVYDRNGRYLRHVLPWPANLPEARLKGLKRIAVDGRQAPYIYNAETRSLVPGLGSLPMQRFVAAPDGRLAFVGLHESGHRYRYNRPGPNRLTVVHSDGSVPENPLRATLSRNSAGAACLALSPGGKTIYAAGVDERGKPRHAIFAMGWDDAVPRVFAGEPEKAGTGATGLSIPRGVAVDAAGNVYVADKGNNRVAVFKSDSSFLGECPVDKPEQVEVHRRTGAIYVLGGVNCKRLQRFDSIRETKPSISTPLKVYHHRKGNFRLTMALDDSADPAIVWLGNRSNWAPYKIQRIEDLGNAFGKPTDIARLAGNNRPDAGPRRKYNLWTSGSIHGMSLDRANRKLFVNKRAYDLKTDRWLPGLDTADGCKEGAGWFGLDGNFYSQVQVWGNIFTRQSPAGAPLPFPGSQAKLGGIGMKGNSFRLRGRGITADHKGHIFSLQQVRGAKPVDAGDATSLVEFDPEGKVVRTVVDSAIRSLNGVCVDAKGNIWLGIGARPAGKRVPDSLAGQDLGRPYKLKKTNVSTDFDWYPFLYGCIVRFPPTGGEIRAGIGGVKMKYGTGRKLEIKGADWIFFGASPMPSWRTSYPDTCLCESPRFDVDDYGRCFFPDAAGFRIGMVDSAGNSIGWFGGYGNPDSAGPGSQVPEPAIAFQWPWLVCVEDGRVYVGDRLNRRVVAAQLAHSVEAACDIR